MDTALRPREDIDTLLKKLQSSQCTVDALLMALANTYRLFSLDERILLVLNKSETPLSPQEIAHRVGFLRPNNRVSYVNASLTSLVRRRKLIKQTTNGFKPLYVLIRHQ